jgi:hypothetical protein
MPFKVTKTEDGKFGLYNKTKKEMSKKTFKTKEAAEKMGLHYDNFSQMRKTKKPEPKTETKEEEDEPAPPKKKKVVRKVKKEPKTEEY